MSEEQATTRADGALALFVSAPVAAFRVPYAREYLETLPCPPPATVYGMLLSLVGEERRREHAGAELALAMLSEPAVSTVVRTSWRLKTGEPPGTGANKRPDYQELLTDVRVAVWLRPGSSEAAPRVLAERVRAVVDREESPPRFGGLALGESTHLVDEVRRLRPADLGRMRVLVADDEGDLTLPLWVDHVGSAGTRWGQFRLQRLEPEEALPSAAWVMVQAPGL
jgi:CRISPR-associated protein Cas5t